MSNGSQTIFASKEDFIAAQSEAYYLALKRLDDERAVAPPSGDPEICLTKERPKSETVFLFLSLIFCPQKVKAPPGSSIADNFLNMIVTGTMSIVGFLIRTFALLIVAAYIYGIFTHKFIGLDAWLMIPYFLLIATLFALLGSTFKIASRELSTETDHERLYGYTSSIMAAFAVVLAVISLIIKP